MYLLKLAFRPWRREFLSQLLHLAVVAFLAVTGAGTGWVSKQMRPSVRRLAGQMTAYGYFEADLPPDRKEAAYREIEDAIAVPAGAKAVRVEPEEFLDRLATKYPALAGEVRDLPPDERDRIVPSYVEITGVLAGPQLERLRKTAGVASVGTTQARNEAAVQAFGSLMRLMDFVAAGIGVVLLTCVVQVLRGGAQSLADAVGLLASWGCGFWKLRLPGLLQGAWLGVMSGTLAGAAYYFGTRLFASQVARLIPVFTDSLSVPGWREAVALGSGVLGICLAVSLAVSRESFGGRGGKAAV